MKFYHRTNAAAEIIKNGFKDATGNYLATSEFSGVWLSDYPLDIHEGADGDSLLVIEIPESRISDFEWIEDEKPYREFLAPADIVNKYGPPELIDEA
jgi:hypothetical protein